MAGRHAVRGSPMEISDKTYLYPDLVESDAAMTNAQTLCSAAFADQGFAMLLALTRNLNQFILDRTIEASKVGN